MRFPRFALAAPFLAALPLAALSLGGCGGGGGGSSSSGGTDFVTFFTNVVQSPASAEPVSLTGITFTNQFPTDEDTFASLLP